MAAYLKHGIKQRVVPLRYEMLCIICPDIVGVVDYYTTILLFF